MSPPLAGRFLTPGPPEESLDNSLSAVHPVLCRILSSILGLHPLNVIFTPTSVVTNKSISRHYPLSWRDEITLQWKPFLMELQLLFLLPSGTPEAESDDHIPWTLFRQDSVCETQNMAMNIHQKAADKWLFWQAQSLRCLFCFVSRTVVMMA